MPRWLPFDERFESYIQRADGDGCWLWLGPRTAAGYGEINRGREVLLAHRVSYEKFVGPIPEGHSVLHQCDNPPCVRPSHFFTGTQTDNLADMRAKGRGRSHRAPGERNHNAKLTASRVRAIRSAARIPGQSMNQHCVRLAAEHGVSRGLILAVITKQSWSHIS